MNLSTDGELKSQLEHIEVKPMTINIGAEISGVDLRKPLSAAEVACIRQALLEWKVIFFRDQHLDHRQHIDFARRFGQPTAGHVVFGNHGEYPEIYPVTKHRKAFAARPAATRVWTDWHSDISAALNPPFASILRGVVIPPYGGDTQFTNMVAAYRALSPTMQKFLSTLRSVHRFKAAAGNDDADYYNEKINSKNLVSEHPLVIVHPETGEHALYTNQEFSDHIVGLEPQESDTLQTFLWEHCLRAEFTMRFRWEAGSIAFWDNRSTQHLAIRDVYNSDFDRELYRVTLNGEIPVGVDGQPSRKISGEPILPV